MKRWIPILMSAAAGLALLFQLASVFAKSTIPDEASVTIIDLGTLGGANSQASDLNKTQQVVGSSTISPTAKTQAFLWGEGVMKPLPVSGELVTFAHAINEQGQVVGAAVTGTDEVLDQRPVLWQEGGFVPLELDNTLQGSARAINDEGLIAGQTLSDNANSLLIWETQGNSFVLTTTVPFSGGLGLVNQVNGQGQIVGVIQDEEIERAFLWEAAEFNLLETLGGSSAAAHDINEAGHIAGSSTVSEEPSTHATLWVDGAPQDLGTLDDAPGASSRALGLNDNGLVVGEADLGGERHAVLWVEGALIDLNDFVPEGSAWEVLQTAVRINNSGWIAGIGLQAGEERAFLMYVPTEEYSVYLPIVTGSNAPTPTPEPSPTPEVTVTPTPTGPLYDMMKYMGDGRLYEVEFRGPNGSSQSRHQTQTDGGRFYHTKGNEIKAEWEELWAANNLIYRGTDTSPGGGRYYSLYENQTLGSSWSPRFWRAGEFYFRQPFVIFYYKSNCQIASSGYLDPSWLKFERFIPSYDSPTLGVPVKNVVQLAWYRGGSNGPTGGPIERYYYGENYGLVAWQSLSEGYSSSISEIFGPGERPDNKREVIPCLGNGLLQTITADNSELNFGPLPEEYARMVRH